MESWESLCRLAAFLSWQQDFWMLHPLLSHCWAQGAAEWEVTKDLWPSCKTAATVSCRGPHTQDEEQAEAQAHAGRQRAVAVPKEQQEQGSDPWKAAFSLPKPPSPPWGHVSGHSLPSSQDGHIHCCHSGLLMSWQDSFQTLYSLTAHMLLC